jgi:hypothetical protein
MSNLIDIIGTEPLPVGESKEYGLLPEGWYEAVITSAEIRDTKSGGGKYIAMAFDITGPTHQGRKVWSNLNIRNQNPKAEEIGRQQLGEIARAIGLSSPKDTSQLINGQLQIKVVVAKSEQYGDKNETKGYKAITGSVPPVPSSTPSTSTPPWAKK